MGYIALFYLISEIIEAELVQFCFPTIQRILHVVECTYFCSVLERDTCSEYTTFNGIRDCLYQCKRSSEIISGFFPESFRRYFTWFVVHKDEIPWKWDRFGWIYRLSICRWSINIKDKPDARRKTIYLLWHSNKCIQRYSDLYMKILNYNLANLGIFQI